MGGSPGAPVDLVARDEGSGPPIVFLHGLAADHTIWGAVAKALASEFRLILPDLRGHGASRAPPSAGYTADDLERDVLALLDVKALPSAHLVGLSAGALLALRLGLEHPDRVRSVVLISGAVYVDAHARSVAERWAETYQDGGPDALAVRLLKDLYYPDWIETHMDLADRLREQLPRQDLSGAMAWGRGIASVDERERVASLRPPALILQAMDDQVVDPAHGRILRQSIPGSRIRIFAQTGHMIPVERPEETAEAIRGFVREVEAHPSR